MNIEEITEYCKKNNSWRPPCVVYPQYLYYVSFKVETAKIMFWFVTQRKLLFYPYNIVFPK